MGEITMKHWLSAIAAITLVLGSAHGARAREEITLIGPLRLA
jgi:hypothetical protein